MAYLVAGFPRFNDVFGMVSLQSDKAADALTRNFATFKSSSSCMCDSRQQQDVSFQDVLAAVKSQVMTMTT